jgi:hypothetical protein
VPSKVWVPHWRKARVLVTDRRGKTQETAWDSSSTPPPAAAAVAWQQQECDFSTAALNKGRGKSPYTTESSGSSRSSTNLMCSMSFLCVLCCAVSVRVCCAVLCCAVLCPAAGSVGLNYYGGLLTESKRVELQKEVRHAAGLPRTHS